MNIGESIKRIRISSVPRLNQGDFAKRIGITQTYLSQIETGAKIPSISVLEVISNQFEIPLAIIFWFGLEESDIAETKRNHYKILKPTVDTMVSEFF